jgi:hypothetical protein
MDTQQQPMLQQPMQTSYASPHGTTINFEPTAGSTTTITFAQVPTEDTAATTTPTDTEPVVADSSTYYPYKSVMTTQPTAQQLLPYISDMKPMTSDPPKTSPLISAGGGSYYFSSTPQTVGTKA